jgi:hypothetical protein
VASGRAINIPHHRVGRTVIDENKVGAFGNIIATPLGNDPFVGNSTTLKELLAKDIKNWREYIKLAKIEPIQPFNDITMV